MNPISYSAAQALDNALVGRFAIFLYPPDVLQMDEADRSRVATHINGDDAPGLSEWTGGYAEDRDSPVSLEDSLRLGQSLSSYINGEDAPSLSERIGSGDSSVSVPISPRLVQSTLLPFSTVSDEATRVIG